MEQLTCNLAFTCCYFLLLAALTPLIIELFCTFEFV